MLTVCLSGLFRGNKVWGSGFTCASRHGTFQGHATTRRTPCLPSLHPPPLIIPIFGCCKPPYSILQSTVITNPSIWLYNSRDHGPGLTARSTVLIQHPPNAKHQTSQKAPLKSQFNLRAFQCAARPLIYYPVILLMNSIFRGAKMHDAGLLLLGVSPHRKVPAANNRFGVWTLLISCSVGTGSAACGLGICTADDWLSSV